MRKSWKTRCEDLEKVIQLTFWMARRYADNRITYAPDMVEEAYKILQNLDVKIQTDCTLPHSKTNPLSVEGMKNSTLPIGDN